MPPQRGVPRRISLPTARDDRLFFAQVREDPLLELAALDECLSGKIVLVGSAGCTALSLIAAGAEDVVGVDLNRTQHHLVELKALAVAELGVADALAFLGAVPSSANAREATYAELAPWLSEGARAYWDRQRRAVRAGVLDSGATERLMSVIAGAIRRFVHSQRKIDDLLECETVAEQRDFYEKVWNTPRWRAVFQALCSRVVLRKTYDEAFFQYVDNPSFARHFLKVIEHTLTELPVDNNYFLHYVLTGAYPVGVPGGVPPYLSEECEPEMRSVGERLTLVDGGLRDYLSLRPRDSISGFSLSNICEWLTSQEIDDLFAEIVRTARPGARLCFRNFLGWTEVPEQWRNVVVEDRPLGELLIRTDRSMVQRRFAVCEVRKGSS